jgi:hypothetical protein
MIADAPDTICALNFVASVIEAGGAVCNPVRTAGGGEQCGVHSRPWPCSVQWTVSRHELVSALRQLGLERDEAEACEFQRDGSCVQEGCFWPSSACYLSEVVDAQVLDEERPESGDSGGGS